ncbi:hypothetical protein Z046_15115 [Pseudomonas aeruginosa VRFPA09]|nr:hypothetical protein CSC30_0066 [Pseudomonas aeruginosa]AWF60471.1 hypothetical protein CSC30_6525 [Pseudomonas aeruginosa]EVT88687.1 hypothetical protein Z046_15115 [Pseudomonas aeruginosa VRFPA09]
MLIRIFDYIHPTTKALGLKCQGLFDGIGGQHERFAAPKALVQH